MHFSAAAVLSTSNCGNGVTSTNYGPILSPTTSNSDHPVLYDVSMYQVTYTHVQFSDFRCKSIHFYLILLINIISILINTCMVILISYHNARIVAALMESIPAKEK